jgi:cell division protein FtsI (penicillin-binding protein 3)
MTLPPEENDGKWGARRARLVAGGLGLVFCVIVGRAAQVALFSGHPPPNAPPTSTETPAAMRADIVDRRGQILATNLPAWNLSADPRAVWNATEVAQGVNSVLTDVNIAELSQKLSDRERAFVPIKSRITPPQRRALMELGLEGLHFEEETRRVYPSGRLAGHLLGFTNAAGRGAEGAEYAFDEQLRTGGEPVRLTLDAGVQFALEDEILKAQDEFTMQGAAGIVIDASNGAIRAMASWPMVDPNKPGQRPEGERKNRALGEVYELGSIFKPLTVAAALEAGVLGLNDRFDVSQPIRIGSRALHDDHMLEHPRSVSVTDILAFSSNVGTVQIAQRIGAQRQRDFLDRMGLLSRLSYNGPQAGAPLTPADWSPLTSATVAYGHGIAVSPLSLAMAYVPFANGGEYLRPSLLEPVDPDQAQRRRVMAAPTARIVVEMMRETVTRGTGRLADAPGWEVAGKTGTAEKSTPDGGYDPLHNITSFAAVFPASRPQFVVLIVLDDAQPRTGDVRTASVTAAAIAGRLITRAAPLLDVEPVTRAPAAEARDERRPVLTPVVESRPL